MHETEPRVYLISRPSVDWPELRAYLSSVGGEAWADRAQPQTGRGTSWGGMSHGEALVEAAGRICYRSWAPELNANVKRVREDSAAYLRNILSSAHGSTLEHAQYGFVFVDVSRVFTHELVRHRAGVAVSQESLRYVRLTDLGFRVPPVLRDDPDHPRCGMTDPPDWDELEDRTGVLYGRCTLLAGHGRWHQEKRDGTVWAQWFGQSSVLPAGSRQPMEQTVVSLVERLEEFQRDAAEAYGLDDEGVPFHVKKEVTSALRRLAPIGLSTHVLWSANARTLRHVIESRTAPGAEEEIRLVFGQVAEVMRREAPLLFGDYEVVDGAYVTPYRKV